ncbi:DnaJ domain-containing protein [Mesorhizobium sp. L103C119B0]|uniref:J domain-containing protein n=1 Tax=Mesorhizobium sp. L103C119B0 TaxID=1287085 RepID=UPI001FD9050E|nr:DnaJ domain-containing protein [Mesorhizobium sp. L103C119B0]
MFVDLYETLEISPNANSETLERVFRYFAMRYHPDNQQTGDEARFSEIVEAHNTLKDPVKRAQYDVAYRDHAGLRRELTQEASNNKGFERDFEISQTAFAALCETPARRQRSWHRRCRAGALVRLSARTSRVPHLVSKGERLDRQSGKWHDRHHR